MAERYNYNPETLSYTKVNKKISKQNIRVWFTPFISGFVIAVMLLLAYSFVLDSPKERNLKRENKFMQQQLEALNQKFDKVNMVLADLQKRDDNIYRAIFEAEPISASVRNAGFGGTDRYKKLSGYDNSEFIINTAKRLDIITKQSAIQSKSFDSVIVMLKSTADMHKSIPAIRPIAKNESRFSSSFGMRVHPILKRLRMHTGIDLSARKGTKIYATADGKVTKANWSGGYGKCIKIDHGFGYTTVYGHLSEYNVKAGQKVKRGQVIGEVGSTGLSTTAHLHYEVRKGGEPVNPINYYFEEITPNEYGELIKFANNIN